MDKQDIQRMAREASSSGDIEELTGDAIERFFHMAQAAAVEQERKEFAVHAIDIARKAIEEEREACAKVCESHIDGTPDYNQAAWNCAEAIRARGEMK
jgi:hypothetical protein